MCYDRLINATSRIHLVSLVLDMCYDRLINATSRIHLVSLVLDMCYDRLINATSRIHLVSLVLDMCYDRLIKLCTEQCSYLQYRPHSASICDLFVLMVFEKALS